MDLKITIDQGEQLWGERKDLVESSSGADDARRIFIMPRQIQSLRQSGCFNPRFKLVSRVNKGPLLSLSLSPSSREANKHDSSPAISCPLPRWIAKLVFVNAPTRSNLCLTNWTVEAVRVPIVPKGHVATNLIIQYVSGGNSPEIWLVHGCLWMVSRFI